MKHSYQADCTCGRCQKERLRRNQQATSDPRRFTQQPKHRARRQTSQSSRRPVHGSQEWAEARGGLIGGYEED